MGEVALLCQVISTRHLTREEEIEESIFVDHPFDIPLLLTSNVFLCFVFSKVAAVEIDGCLETLSWSARRGR